MIEESRTVSDRDSLHVIGHDLSSSIYVEAGAGTGKTYSLVQRIMALLKGDVPIENIVAITFTRAAASELRSRIREELEKSYVPGSSEPWVRKALEGIDRAAFQTIDSLVYSILSEHALAAGLPPAIEVQDSFSQLEMFRERQHQWVIDLMDQDESFAQTLSVAMSLGLQKPFDKIAELARAMDEKHGDLETGESTPPPRIGVETIEELEGSIEELRATMRWCKDPEDRLYMQMAKVIDWFEMSIQGRGCRTEKEAEALLMTFSGTSSAGGRNANWGDGARKEEARDVLKNVIAEVEGALDIAREAVTIELIGYVRKFVQTVVEERRRAGTVSYYDAITWLNEMLARRSDIREEIQQRYPRVLVDEFQDTDPNQVKLVRLLTIPPGNNIAPAPGSMFAVGDPKQSIYKFRGADVEISQGVKDDVREHGEYLTLRENRRSTDAVINWVNHVFNKWMRSDNDGFNSDTDLQQAEYIPLKVASDTAAPDEVDGHVYYFGDELAMNVDTLRETDAVEVAKIARSVCAGKVKVRDRHDNDRVRDSRPGDLTILTRARSSWELYMNELDKLGLPYVADIGGAAVFETQEFSDLLNCLTAMDDPSDQPATAGALKSIYFGCSDVHLHDWALQGGKFSCVADFPQSVASSEVYDAMEVLRRYHRLRDELPPPVLIERFIRERQARESMYLNGDPRAGLRRLDLAVELSRGFMEEGVSSLRGCLKRFAQYQEADEFLREEPALEFDQGKIRLMTIHASKGLEFPIVILPDLCGSGRNSNPILLMGSDSSSNSGAKFGMRLGGSGKDGYFQTEGYEELLAREKRASELETTRLFYVACTRARDHLIVSGYRKSRDTKSVAARFADYVGSGGEALWSPIPDDWFSAEFDPKVDVAPSTMIQPAADREVWTREHRRIMEWGTARSWVTPSDLKRPGDETKFDGYVEKPDDAPIPDSDDYRRQGRAATKIGQAVHAAVQRVLERPGADVESIARQEAEKHDVSENSEEVAQLTAATLSTPLIRRVRKLHRDDVWVEIPVAAPIDADEGSPKVLEGRVDLIYRIDEHTLGIADFKTDRSFNRSVGEMAVPYEPQIGGYAYAVERATGLKVVEACILFSRLALEDASQAEYWLPNIENVKNAAMSLAAAQVAGST